ncbi:hypothetical protein K7640_24925 [Micromonospora sp. PLK6-60]|uniref:hypothetical protein n=1 Tax=Micromonospora sp. PLK6-60 TaxID=2873383 RepID=UPI001CA66836|nr:hypothetical protein [Micromonospora sp. PLK6-60]MBY8875077.1 hypothetical protein [Micromonospora sp. PLK6-60]
MRVPQLARAVVVALVGSVAVAGCGHGEQSANGAGEVGAAPTNAVPGTINTVAPGEDGPSGDPAGQPAAGEPGKGQPDSGQGRTNTGGRATTKPPAAAPGPTIVSFRVRQQPSCPSGTNVNLVPGSPVVLEWRATGVDKVALSVDGPGIYRDDYPPSGSESLNFPCSGAEGDIQKHTYLLTVTGSAGKATKSLTVTATVHEIPSV